MKTVKQLRHFRLKNHLCYNCGKKLSKKDKRIYCPACRKGYTLRRLERIGSKKSRKYIKSGKYKKLNIDKLEENKMDIKNIKIWCNSFEESQLVQNKLFKLGAKWNMRKEDKK